MNLIKNQHCRYHHGTPLNYPRDPKAPSVHSNSLTATRAVVVVSDYVKLIDSLVQQLLVNNNINSGNCHFSLNFFLSFIILHLTFLYSTLVLFTLTHISWSAFPYGYPDFPLLWLILVFRAIGTLPYYTNDKRHVACCISRLELDFWRRLGGWYFKEDGGRQPECWKGHVTGKV